jgi:hypothetical protein
LYRNRFIEKKNDVIRCRMQDAGWRMEEVVAEVVVVTL